jgi:Family of unknown function (DUF5759)
MENSESKVLSYDLSKLYSNNVNRSQTKIKVYNEILRRIHSRIDLVVKHGHSSDTSCLFEVPPYLMGYPIYDMNETLDFLVSSLRQNGFYVQVTKETVLFISWEQKYIEPYIKANEPKQFLQNILNQENSSNIYTTSTPSSSTMLPPFTSTPSSNKVHVPPKPVYHSTGKLFQN